MAVIAKGVSPPVLGKCAVPLPLQNESATNQSRSRLFSSDQFLNLLRFSTFVLKLVAVSSIFN
jgi:hypothetical protein